MRKFFLSSLLIACLFPCIGPVLAQAPVQNSSISEADKDQIAAGLKDMERAVNEGDQEKISSLVSLVDDFYLVGNIRQKTLNGIDCRFDYAPLDNNIEMQGSGIVKVNARLIYPARSLTNGSSIYFIFEKRQGKWMITDTDFYTKVENPALDNHMDDMADRMFNNLWMMYIIFMPIFFISSIFVIWILVDCAKRDFDDKTLWIILLLVFNLPAAILYYFMVKRRDLKRKPLEFKQ